jgi:hypothetical protein
MTIDDIRADIAFMKDLVDDGTGAGRERGGIWMTVSGVVFSVASLVVWWITTHEQPSSSWSIAAIWVGASAIDSAICVPLTANLPRGGNASGRALYTIGLSLSITVGALFCAAILASLLTHNYLVWTLFPSIVLAMYASFWLVTAAVTREKWRNLVAAGSYIAAAIFTPVANRPEGCLLFAVCLTLFATLPGIALLRTKCV